MTTETLDKITEQIKELIGDDYQDAVVKMQQDESDFIIEDYRFVHKNIIQSILEEEISEDTYLLGCFNADFIASVTNWPIVLIETMQKAEHCDALGRAIKSSGFVPEMAEQYASTDGYGHHFSSYDGQEYEIGNYYVFRLC